VEASFQIVRADFQIRFKNNSNEFMEVLDTKFSELSFVIGQLSANEQLSSALLAAISQSVKIISLHIHIDLFVLVIDLFILYMIH
jgi:hypothetical protein